MRQSIKMKTAAEKEKDFLAVTNQYKEVIAKVCYLYSSAWASFDDLYQEVLINLWQGLDSFKGESKNINMDLPHGNQHMYHLAQAQRPLYPPAHRPPR